MDRTRSKWIAAAIIAAAGVIAQGIRATEPRDPGLLGLAHGDVSLGQTPYADDSLDPEFAEALRSREILYRTYAPGSDTPVWVFLAYFDRQREGSQVHSPRHCYPGSGWSIEEEFGMPAPWRGGEVRALVVSDGAERRIVCYWYQTPAGVTGDVLRLKLALTRQAVIRAPQDVVFGNVSTTIDSDLDSAWSRVAAYVRGAESEIERLYRERDERRTGSH